MNKVITLPAIEGAESIPAVIGIDLAKNVFALHAVNRNGKTVLVKPHIRRDQLLGLLAQLPPCIVDMEACSGAHDWARELAALGHISKNERDVGPVARTWHECLVFVTQHWSGRPAAVWGWMKPTSKHAWN